MKLYKIVLLWSIMVILFAVVDIFRFPFTDHITMTIIRGLVIVVFWYFMPGNKVQKYVGWPLFLIFWYWWLFDSIMGFHVMGKVTYIGETSTIDVLQRKIGFPFLPLWIFKFFMAVIGLSIIIYKDR